MDLADDTDPEWRANHPNAKGVTRVAGSSFQSSFPEPSSINSTDAEEQVLQKVVSDYNSSGNPGKFALRKETEGRYAVIGTSLKDETGKDETVDVLLDTPISLPLQQRSATGTLQVIVDALAKATNVKVFLGTIGLSSDPLQGVEVLVGGTAVPARALLLQTLDAAGKNMVIGRVFRWNLLFDADQNVYFLRLTTATKSHLDASGKRTIRFIDR